MTTIAALGMVSFVLGMILTPLCRNLALHFDIVDRADAQRKLHAAPTPRIGGVAIALAYAGALGLVLWLTPQAKQLHIQHLETLHWMLPGAAVIFLTGLLDDLIGLKPKQKLLGQLIGAVLAVSLGIHSSPLNSPVASNQLLMSNHWIAIPFSILWLVTCTNAINLIDGLDGLASGVGLVASIATLLLGVFTGHNGLILATIPLVGALLAFLFYNFNPASIFLGDSGSLTIGFMLGVFSLIWSENSSSLFGIAAPLMVLALPLADVSLAIFRRYLRMVPIFSADRRHVHHIVQSRGFRARDTALILYAVCALAASLALAQSLNIRVLRYAALILFVGLVCAGIRYLNYVELVSLGKALSLPRVRLMVKEDLYLEDLKRTLSAMNTPEECWEQTRTLCAALQFSEAEMYFLNRHFEARLDEDAPELAWQITIPVGELGYLRVTRGSEDAPNAFTLEALSRLCIALAERERHVPRSRPTRLQHAA